MNNMHYFITPEQLEQLSHYWRMFYQTAERVETICSEENAAINTGFELGKLYMTLSTLGSELSELDDAIRKQRIEYEADTMG